MEIISQVKIQTYIIAIQVSEDCKIVKLNIAVLKYIGMLQFEMSSKITVSMKNGKIKGNKRFTEQLTDYGANKLSLSKINFQYFILQYLIKFKLKKYIMIIQ